MSTQSVYSRIILKSQKLISEGIVILDANKKKHPILFINKGFKKITGFNSAYIIGKNFKSFFNTKSTDANITKYDKAITDKKNAIVDLYLKRNHDQFCYCRVSISFIKDESNPIGYFLLIVRDITEMRKSLLNELKLDVVKTTLSSVNDIVYNYMQGLLLFRDDCEEHCSSPKVKFEIFDKQYTETIKKLRQINKLQEYKERKIGGADSNLVMLAPE